MEGVSLRVAKISGAASETGWAQSFFFTPENKDLLEKRGSLLACFSVFDEEGVNPEFGQDLIDRLQEEYYGQTAGLPMPRLVDSLEAIAQEIAESRVDFKVEITAGVFWKGVWYFAVLGEGKVLVKRGPTISAVLVGEAAGQVVSSSGKAEKGDVVILGTTGFFVLRDDLIQQALSQESLEKIAEKLSGGLSSALGKGDAAGLLVELVSKEPLASLEPDEEPEKKKPRSFSLPRFSPSFFSGRRLILVLVLVLIVASSVGGFFFFRQKDSDLHQKAEETVSQAEAKYKEAQSLASLDKEQAARILTEARDLLASVSLESEKKSQLQEDIDRLLASLNEVPSSPGEALAEFFSLSEIELSLKLTDLATSGKTIYLLDNNAGKVYSLGWEDQKSEVVLGEEKIKKATGLFVQAGEVILLADDGFYEIANNKLNKIIEADDSWGKVVDFDSWLGNLYLLDVQNEVIWQYPATRDGFGAIRKWNKEDLPPVGEGSAITIDAAIWLAGDKLYKLYQGYLEDTYEISDLGGEALVYTGADFDNVYLVDKENSRFLAVNKETGEVSNEKKALDLDKAQGLVVSPDETVAVIGTPDKLLKVALE